MASLNTHASVDTVIPISVHGTNIQPETALALAKLILCVPEIQYQQQRLAAPMLAAEIDELRSALNR
jgi:hypothetical protein